MYKLLINKYKFTLSNWGLILYDSFNIMSPIFFFTLAGIFRENL